MTQFDEMRAMDGNLNVAPSLRKLATRYVAANSEHSLDAAMLLDMLGLTAVEGKDA